jgi:hypothetical protein
LLSELHSRVVPFDMAEIFLALVTTCCKKNGGALEELRVTG